MHVEYKLNINSHCTKMCGPVLTENGCSGYRNSASCHANVLLEVVMRFVVYLNARLLMHLPACDREGFPGGEIEHTGSWHVHSG